MEGHDWKNDWQPHWTRWLYKSVSSNIRTSISKEIKSFQMTLLTAIIPLHRANPNPNLCVCVCVSKLETLQEHKQAERGRVKTGITPGVTHTQGGRRGITLHPVGARSGRLSAVCHFVARTTTHSQWTAHLPIKRGKPTSFHLSWAH